MIDEQTAEELKADFTSRNTIDHLFTACERLAKALGVRVQWKVLSSNPDADVDRAGVSAGMKRLVTAIAALSAGSKVNPLQLIQEKERESESTSIEEAARSVS